MPLTFLTCSTKLNIKTSCETVSYLLIDVNVLTSLSIHMSKTDLLLQATKTLISLYIKDTLLHLLISVNVLGPPEYSVIKFISIKLAFYYRPLKETLTAVYHDEVCHGYSIELIKSLC